MGEKEIEAEISAYLSAIKEKFGYIAAYVVSEKTRRYYTPGEIAKIVNPLEEPYDIWYQLFLDSGKDLDLDTDRDQVNDYRWTVFINVRMTDDDGSFIGVCGSFVYTSKGISGFRFTRYLEELEWFLVVQGVANQQGSFMHKLSVILLYLILIALFLLAFFTKQNSLHQSLSKPSLTQDMLTVLIMVAFVMTAGFLILHHTNDHNGNFRKNGLCFPH